MGYFGSAVKVRSCVVFGGLSVRKEDFGEIRSTSLRGIILTTPPLPVPLAIAGAAITTSIIAISAATARTKKKRFMRNLLFLWVVGCTTGSVRLAKVPI